MNNRDAVLKYIDYLKSEIPERPQCMMVGMLLLVKFENAKLYYDSNHVITKIGDKFYDWDGEAKAERHTPFEGYGDNWVVNHYRAIQKWNED